MEPLQQRAFESAIKTLQNMGCKYVVIDPDGNKHGTLEDEKKKKVYRYKHGEVTEFIKNQLGGKTPEVGVSGEVDCGAFDPETVRSSLINLTHKESGNGAMTTQVNRDTNRVIFYRAF
jgi:hypothetical protein